MKYATLGLIIMRAIIFILLICFNVCQANSGSVTGLEIPRYVSLKSNESNLRVGPSKNYPILIKYIISEYPLKVIDEYKDWRKVSDSQNNFGWLHKSIITGIRTGIIVSDKDKSVSVFNIDNGIAVGEVNIGSIVKLNKCKKNWCLISRNENKGWIKKKYIWGVEKDEELNISYLQSFIDFYFKTINVLSRSFF
tara:strand:+ start:70 stop:651 length:582 start_codon:yes stop_codon:yes gene_type:complete